MTNLFSPLAPLLSRARILGETTGGKGTPWEFSGCWTGKPGKEWRERGGHGKGGGAGGLPPRRTTSPRASFRENRGAGGRVPSGSADWRDTGKSVSLYGNSRKWISRSTCIRNYWSPQACAVQSGRFAYGLVIRRMKPPPGGPPCDPEGPSDRPFTEPMGLGGGRWNSALYVQARG